MTWKHDYTNSLIHKIKLPLDGDTVFVTHKFQPINFALALDRVIQSVQNCDNRRRTSTSIAF